MTMNPPCQADPIIAKPWFGSLSDTHGCSAAVMPYLLYKHWLTQERLTVGTQVRHFIGGQQGYSGIVL